MTKKLAAVISISAITAIALVATVLSQGGHITRLEQTLFKTDKQLKEEKLLRETAEQQLQVYVGMVEKLQLENEQLNAKIDELKGTISKLNKVIQKHDDKVATLTAEINRLKEGGKKNEAQIRDLERQRDEQLIKMEEMDKERISLFEYKRQNEESQKLNEESQRQKAEEINALKKVQREMVEAEPVPFLTPAPNINQSPSEPVEESFATAPKTELEATIVTRQQERLNNVVNKTAVKFSSISLRNREGGNELKRIKKEDNWQYTFIDFDLDNADKAAIMDEYFIVQLFDLDKKVVVPFNERNMAYPNSEMGATGYKFKYDGKPVSVRYINTQPKEGRNYELRLIYPRTGLYHQLVNGTKTIVEDGKVVVD